MTDELIVQTFNDDLLIDPQGRETARRAFPHVFHVLDDEELRQLFVPNDREAGRAKRSSFLAGILAVSLVVIGLFGTSAERLYEGHKCASAIAIASVILSITGVAIGLGGLMIWKSKTDWLYRRMLGERLRQYHFQTFVCRAAEISESLKGKTEQGKFLEQRQIWLSEFKLRFLPNLESEFNALLKREQGVWLHPAPVAPDALLDALPEEFFKACAALRIRHQLQYADWKIRYGQNVFSGFSVRGLETFLANGSVIMTLCLVVTEILIILPLLPYTNAAMSPAFGPWGHWIAICFAVAALGMRTLEDGLQPKRELERYQRYSNLVADICERFDVGSRAEKFEAMIELERLAFEEMRDFLRSSYESRFVM
jgi:hypothetical protein